MHLLPHSIRASFCTLSVSHMYDIGPPKFLNWCSCLFADEEGEDILWLLVEWDDHRLSIIPAGWLKELQVPNSSTTSGLKVPFNVTSYWGKKAANFIQ